MREEKEKEERIKGSTCAGRAVKKKYQRRLSDEGGQQLFFLREGGKEVGV